MENRNRYKTRERLLPRLGPDTLVLADRGFPSHDLYVATLATGADVLWRVSASFALPVLACLPDGIYLSELRGARKKDRVAVRVIEYSILDDDGISEVFALITNLLDPEAAPALELAYNYSQRWRIELLFRLVKVDLRTPGGVLRSRKPEGVRQELWGLLCLYQALRTLITRAAVIAGVDATRISFPLALDAVTDSVGRAFPPRDLATALAFSIADIPGWVIRHRPDRTAPRRSRPSVPACVTPPGVTPILERVWFTRTIRLHLLEPGMA